MNIFKSIKSKETPIKSHSDTNNFFFGKDEILEPKSLKIFGKKYSLNIYYYKTKNPELNIENDNVNIFLPIKFRKQDNQVLLNNFILKMYTKISENEIENVMEKARHKFGFVPEDYEIKKIPKYLATVNQELQSITVNPYISMYSKEIIEYIIFHEFCHLKYKTHSKKFNELLENAKPNYKSIESQIPNLKF